MNLTAKIYTGFLSCIGLLAANVATLAFDLSPTIVPPHSLIIRVAKCTPEEKEKCRAKADLGMANSTKAWCIRGDGTNVCRERVLDESATCLTSCGDTGAIYRRSTLGGPSGSRCGARAC